MLSLKSKMHLFIKQDNKVAKKGINNNVAKNMSHEEYKNAPFEKKQLRHNMKTKSKSHQIETFNITKMFYCALMINDIYLMTNQNFTIWT